MARMENNDTKKIMNIILIGLAIFLLLDSFLSIIFGKRYILWGLEYTPSKYRNYIKNVSLLPARTLFGIRFIEITIGTMILWVGLL